MCKCPKVHFYEVKFKLEGMRTIAVHKNCGDVLSEAQFAEFEKNLVKLWSVEGA
ncbi:MAG: hypothetical protein QXU32_07775 [Nitrososphaerales archaeon]